MRKLCARRAKTDRQKTRIEPEMIAPFVATAIGETVRSGMIAVLLILSLVAVLVVFKYGALWLQAYMSSADVKIMSLIGMTLRGIDPSMIVRAKIMSVQAALNVDGDQGISTASLESHALAGGDVMLVLRSIVAADRAGIDLNFDRAATIDLAGRDVLAAVRTSVSPRVIDCPDRELTGKTTISAVAKDGVELRVQTRVTVRTNIGQLIGGATEETIIARVGEGIITAIGSATNHMAVMGMPDRISRQVLSAGLDSNTAFEIVSIDIADVSIGDNIGARLQSDQAEADTRMARARAEVRRTGAVAQLQEMTSRLAQSRASLVMAEAEVPPALAEAFAQGQLRIALRPDTVRKRLCRDSNSSRAQR